MTGWNELAEENGFIAVYPKGTGFPLRWITRPSEETPGAVEEELQFFSDLIDHLSSTYNIDLSRVYANGMSNGSGLSDLLACEFSARVTALGGVAGAYAQSRKDCQPIRPVPGIKTGSKAIVDALLIVNPTQEYSDWGFGFLLWHSAYFSVCAWISIFLMQAPRKNSLNNRSLNSND